MIIVGHTHQQFIKDVISKKIVNPGALGEDKGDYCLIDKLGNIYLKNLMME